MIVYSGGYRSAIWQAYSTKELLNVWKAMKILLFLSLAEKQSRPLDRRSISTWIHNHTSLLIVANQSVINWIIIWVFSGPSTVGQKGKFQGLFHLNVYRGGREKKISTPPHPPISIFPDPHAPYFNFPRTPIPPILIFPGPPTPYFNFACLPDPPVHI